MHPRDAGNARILVIIIRRMVRDAVISNMYRVAGRALNQIRMARAIIIQIISRVTRGRARRHWRHQMYKGLSNGPERMFPHGSFIL